MGITIGITTAMIAADQSVRQAHKQSGLQHRSALAQKNAQQEAVRLQMIERQRAVQAEQKANRPTPGSSIVMNDALLSPTDKTGGLDDRLRLSKSSKLGGGV